MENHGGAGIEALSDSLVGFPLVRTLLGLGLVVAFQSCIEIFVERRLDLGHRRERKVGHFLRLTDYNAIGGAIVAVLPTGSIVLEQLDVGMGAVGQGLSLDEIAHFLGLVACQRHAVDYIQNGIGLVDQVIAVHPDHGVHDTAVLSEEVPLHHRRAKLVVIEAYIAILGHTLTEASVDICLAVELVYTCGIVLSVHALGNTKHSQTGRRKALGELSTARLRFGSKVQIVAGAASEHQSHAGKQHPFDYILIFHCFSLLNIRT